MDNKQQHWRAVFQQFERSNQTVASFCRQQGITPAMFYYRRAQLAQSPAASGFRALVGPAPNGLLSGPAALTVSIWRGAVRVELSHFDASVVRAVVDALT